MARASRGARLLAASVALALMMFSFGFSWAVADDHSRLAVLPAGSVVAGVDVGGMPRDEAVETVRERVIAPLTEPIDLEARGRRFAFDPKRVLTIDVEGMVDGALAPSRRATMSERIYRRVMNEQGGVSVPATLRIDEHALVSWVGSTAKAVYTAPVDSKLSVAGTRLVASPSRTGWKLDAARTTVLLKRGMSGGERPSKLPLTAVKPKVTEQSFGRTLLAKLSERRVYLYSNTRLVKSYPIAVGQDSYPTPPGWWKVVEKQHDPTWTNPGSAWAAGMPDFIPPGPGNPMGVRAILLSAPGVAFHGTSNDASVGTAASHGCMRMHSEDVIDLFDRVEVGDRAIIEP